MNSILAPDGAIFDFDGVIIDSRGAVRTAINDALAHHGLLTRPGPELDRFLGPPTLVAFAQLTGEGPDSALVSRCVATFHERYAEVYLDQTAMSALEEPKSATVERALRALEATEPVVVDDRSFDVDAAHANGLPAIGVTWGIGDRHELQSAGADVIVEHPEDLLTLLDHR